MRASLNDRTCQLLSSRFYAIADWLLDLQTVDERAAQLAACFLGEFHQTRPSSDLPFREPDYTIKLHCAPAPPLVPPRLDSFEVENGRCYTDGESLYVSVGDVLAHVGPCATRRADVWLAIPQGGDAPLALTSALSYTLHAALRRGGRYQLHAAGVVEPSTGEGVVIVSDSGNGKSTLTVRLAAHGWRYLSDDSLLLTEDDDGINAWGLRRIFALTESSLAGCPLPHLREALGPPLVTDPSKRRIKPQALFPGGFAASGRPRALVFTQLTGEAESRLASLSRAASMARLLEHCPWASYDAAVARPYLRALSRLVEQSACYTLAAGRDLLDDPARAASLLGSCVRS